MPTYRTSRGGKMTHKNFRKILVWDLIVQTHETNITVSGVSRGMPSSSGAQLSRLEVKHLQHWSSIGKQRRHVCSLIKKTRSTLFCCKMCAVGLCHGLLREVAYAGQSVSTEWSYCKLWSDAVHTRVQSEQEFIEYSVIIFFLQNERVSGFKKKKLRASPLEFHITYTINMIFYMSWQNNHRIFSFVQFVLFCMCRKFYCLSGCFEFVYLCCIERKMCSFFWKSATLKTYDHLNSDCRRVPDNLKVRTLKVKLLGVTYTILADCKRWLIKYCYMYTHWAGKQVPVRIDSW
jgi:hypothetical protein